MVGAGPAGSITAYLLARAGLRTAVIDAHTFPRTKPCGGGLQTRTLKSIPFDVSHLFRGSFHRMTLSFGLQEPCTRSYPTPFGYSILRTEFDHFLLGRAQEAGALTFEANPVKCIDISDKGVSVRTSGSDLHCQVLVGADGANSLVRASINHRQDYFWQAAVSCEVPEEALKSNALGGMIIDWGTLPCGYAWAFPKRGYLNIGAGAPVSLARDLKGYVEKFVRSADLLKSPATASLPLIGHQLPTLTSRTRLADNRIVLVGDAAGLVEPFTGDGISFACQSARIASNCIIDGFSRFKFDFGEYGKLLRSEVGEDLEWSRKLLSLSIMFPRLIYGLFKNNDRVWNTFCRTLRGEDSFLRLKKDVLGPFEFAWKLIELFASVRERRVLGLERLLIAR